MNKQEFDQIAVKANARERAYGRINVYQCTGRCGMELVTKDVDNGTTPFMKACPRCGGTGLSKMYRVDQNKQHTHEWYRPDFNEYQAMSPAMKQHIELGGLNLRMVAK